jgi:HEPN domain-containing protein
MFHAQQAAEKAMKGLLASRGRAFRKTHDLEELGMACIQIDASLASLFRETVRLTAFAWIFRYPGTPDRPEETEDREALNLAQRVVEAVQDRIPGREGR